MPEWSAETGGTPQAAASAATIPNASGKVLGITSVCGGRHHLGDLVVLEAAADRDRLGRRVIQLRHLCLQGRPQVAEPGQQQPCLGMGAADQRPGVDQQVHPLVTSSLPTKSTRGEPSTQRAQRRRRPRARRGRSVVVGRLRGDPLGQRRAPPRAPPASGSAAEQPPCPRRAARARSSPAGRGRRRSPRGLAPCAASRPAGPLAASVPSRANGTKRSGCGRTV